jgi:hypothetical protein
MATFLHPTSYWKGEYWMEDAGFFMSNLLLTRFFIVI